MAKRSEVPDDIDEYKRQKEARISRMQIPANSSPSNCVAAQSSAPPLLDSGVSPPRLPLITPEEHRKLLQSITELESVVASRDTTIVEQSSSIAQLTLDLTNAKSKVPDAQLFLTLPNPKPDTTAYRTHVQLINPHHLTRSGLMHCGSAAKQLYNFLVTYCPGFSLLDEKSKIHVKQIRYLAFPKQREAFRRTNGPRPRPNRNGQTTKHLFGNVDGLTMC